MKDCTFCRNAHTDPSLTPDTDLAYLCIGELDEYFHADGFRAYMRSGDSRYTALLVESAGDCVWVWYPRYCPNCGRHLIENEDRYGG